MATSKMIFEKAIGVCKPIFTEKLYQTSQKPYKRCHQGPLNELTLLLIRGDETNFGFRLIL